MSDDETEAGTEAGTSSQLNKEELNRIIVRLRPLTEQAKVHTVHHLTKQIKALKGRKHSTDQQREQNERKVERFRREIEILKKASRDSIGRWVLVNKMTFNDILKEETKTQNFDLEARVFCRISDHSATKSVIEEFRQKYEDWEVSVPTLLSTLGKKRKKMDKTKTKISSEPDTDPDQSEGSDSNSDDDGEAPESEDDEAESDGSEDIFVASLKAAAGTGKNGQTVEEKEQSKKSQLKTDRKTGEGEGVVRYLDLNSMQELPKTETDRKNNPTTTSISGNPEKRSSFFVGGESDEEKNESDADEASEDDSDEDPMVTNVHRRIEMFQKQNKNDRKSFPSKRKLQPRENFNKKPRFEGRNDRGKYEKKTMSRGAGNKDPVKTSTKNEKVHPSWAAKQKQKPSIQAFAGSKIVFDDSESAGDKKSTQKPSVPGKVGVSADKVHPSWEAKQKQKPSIQAFAGSKIVFDD